MRLIHEGSFGLHACWSLIWMKTRPNLRLFTTGNKAGPYVTWRVVSNRMHSILQTREDIESKVEYL